MNDITMESDTSQDNYKVAGNTNEWQQNYHHNSYCNDQIMAFQYQVDETLSLFPFVCGLCFEKFDNISVYYNHLNSTHKEAQSYFHSSQCSRVEATGPESSDGDISEMQLFSCGNCSYVSPSLCQLHEHLVERECATMYQLVMDNRTAYPCSVKEEVVDDQESFTETNTEQESHSSTSQVLKKEQYQNPEADLSNIKSNKFTSKTSISSDKAEGETMSRTKVNLEKDVVIKKSDKLSRKTKSTQPPKIKKNKNDHIEDELSERVTAVEYKALVEDEIKNEKNQFNSLDNDGQKITTDYTHDEHSEHIKEPVESTACKSEDSSTSAFVFYSEKLPISSDSGSEERREDDCKPVPFYNTYIPCDRCGVSVCRKRMKYHMIIHNDERDFQCELCKFRFKTLHKLNNHKKTVHVEKDTAICQVCGKAFKHHSYLKQHVEIHSERDKKCPQCPAVFSTIKMLRRHMTSHSDEKPHKCSLCDKEFAHKGGLSNHMRQVHTETRPHVCPTCGKGFKLRNDLRKHMTYHEPPKYGCPVCFKMFVKPYTRKVHMRQHIQRGEFEEDGILSLNSVTPK